MVAHNCDSLPRICLSCWPAVGRTVVEEGHWREISGIRVLP